MTDVKVEQCDRVAAAEYGMKVLRWNRDVVDATEFGEADNDALIQAFARHRQAAEKAQQERDAGIVKKHPMRFVGMTEAHIRDRLSTAIRSQGHE